MRAPSAACDHWLAGKPWVTTRRKAKEADARESESQRGKAKEALSMQGIWRQRRKGGGVNIAFPGNRRVVSHAPKVEQGPTTPWSWGGSASPYK